MIPVRYGASQGGLPMVEQEESLEPMLTHRKLMTVCCAAVLTLGLAACGGGGGGGSQSQTQPSTGSPGGTPAQVSPTLTPAEQLSAAEMAVTTAEAAVAAATTDAERADAYEQLATARADLAAAQALPENIVQAQYDSVAAAIMAARAAIDALDQTSSQADVDAANLLVAAAQDALDAAGMLSEEQMATKTGLIAGLTMDVTANDVLRDRHAVSTAVAAARTAVEGLSSTPTEAEVKAANDAVAAAQTALTDASNLPDEEASAYQLALGSLGAQIMTASSTGTELAAAQLISDLYLAIQNARNAADQAVEDAAAAAKQAADYEVKRTSQAVNGESMTAEENAQKVLDGGTEASAAVMAAEAAKTALEALDTEGIAEDAKAALDLAIVAAGEHIDAQIVLAEASETTAEGHVMTVEGTNMDMPVTPADDAMAVAVNINTALTGAGTLTDGATDITIGAAAMYPMDAVVMNDADEIDAKTWADIVGEAKIVDARIADSATASKAVKAMSVADMTLATTQTATAADATETDGTQFGGTYKGIAGTVFCNGADCKVESVPDVGTSGQDGFVNNTGNRKLAGSWFFTPTLPDELWIAGTGDAAGTYVVATQYARYGYWLDFDANGAATINTYAASGSILTSGQTANTANLDLGGDADDNPVTANYTGGAVGISVLDDAQGEPMASGRFDATVTLTARFADAPTLGGNVTGFTGNAVNPDWNVTLNQTALGTGSFDNGIAYGGDAAGVWSATGYGPPQTTVDDETVDHRPDGFFGRFNANMIDGRVAGAYATRD